MHNNNGNGVQRTVDETLPGTLLECNGEEDKHCPYLLSQHLHLDDSNTGKNKLIIDCYTCDEKCRGLLQAKSKKSTVYRWSVKGSFWRWLLS